MSTQKNARGSALDRKKGRVAWIDALRAIPMFLVIMGHILKGVKPFHLFTAPIKLPLFFAISGYLLRTDRPAKTFFKGIIRRLFIPWLIAYITLELATAAVHRGFSPQSFLGKLVPEPVLWYIPCLIIAEIIWYALRRACRTDIAVVAGAVILSAAGFVMAKWEILNVFMINRSFIAQFYLLIGFTFKKLERRVNNTSWFIVFAGVALYLALGLLSMRIWPNQHIDVHTNRYYNAPFCLLMIAVGCMTLFALFSKWSVAPGMIVFVGQNTLIYYMSSNLIMKTLQKLLSITGIHLNVYQQAALLFIPICLLCALLSLLVNRFLPELAGKSRFPGIKHRR